MKLSGDGVPTKQLLGEEKEIHNCLLKYTYNQCHFSHILCVQQWIRSFTLCQLIFIATLKGRLYYPQPMDKEKFN